MAIGAWNEDELREFVRRELDRSDLDALVRQLQGLFGRARVSWGLIRGSDGVKLAGTSDYTVVRNSAGNYTVTWTPAKAGANYAVLLATANTPGGSVGDYFSKAAATLGLQVFTSTTGANADTADLSFLVLDAQG